MRVRQSYFAVRCSRYLTTAWRSTMCWALQIIARCVRGRSREHSSSVCFGLRPRVGQKNTTRNPAAWRPQPRPPMLAPGVAAPACPPLSARSRADVNRRSTRRVMRRAGKISQSFRRSYPPLRAPMPQSPVQFLQCIYFHLAFGFQISRQTQSVLSHILEVQVCFSLQPCFPVQKQERGLFLCLD